MKISDTHLLLISLISLTYILYVQCDKNYFHYFTGSLIIVILTYALLFVSAKPNQWLLILKNQKLLQSGIGITAFRLPFQKTIKFKNTLQNVPITIISQSSQRQRIKFQAQIFYTVHRLNPLQFYLRKQKNSQIIQLIIQSSFQNHTINNSLTDIFHKDIGTAIKQQTKSQLKEKGIFLETFSITSIKILSPQVFKNLQAQYRLELKQWVDKKKAEKENEIKKSQHEAGMSIKNQKNVFKNKIQLTEKEFELMEDIQKKQYLQAIHFLQIKKINIQKQSQIYKASSERQLQLLKVDQKQKIQLQKH